MSKPLSASHLQLILVIVFLFSVGFSGQGNLALAAEPVTGTYLSATGTAIVLNLNIQQPSPVSMIVEQYLEPGNSIAGTSPHAVKIDLSQTKVKWLFKHVESGKMSLSVFLKSPLKGRVSAMVRYRTPNSGVFTELRITP